VPTLSVDPSHSTSNLDEIASVGYVWVMHEVRLSARSPRDLADIIGHDRATRLVAKTAPEMQAALAGRSVINVNSTMSGGGVAEMLQVLLPLARGADVDARWLVIEADEEFFAITKRLHHRLHGQPGDAGSLGTDELHHYLEVSRANSDELAAVVVEGDVVVLHDPQTAGMARFLRGTGAPIVWRSHIGSGDDNQWTQQAWHFLRPLLEDVVDAFVFTRAEYAPQWVTPTSRRVIAPSIDPLAPKNRYMSPSDARRILQFTGILGDGETSHVPFVRADGSPGRIERFVDVVRTGPAPAPDVPLVTQVSRWDPLKDMAGVMQGFVEEVLEHSPAHLVLAGPVVTAVADDPEAAMVLEDVQNAWRRMPHHHRSRVQLACLPMADVEENAMIVNALQRHSAVVVQKSLAEGFGLTVTEAMFKGTPVVASAVGGIVDQITDGQNGLLVQHPDDRAEFGGAVNRLLSDASLAARLGAAGRETVTEKFLPDTSLDQWHQLLSDVLREARP
jgi:trehalose synthase